MIAIHHCAKEQLAGWMLCKSGHPTVDGARQRQHWWRLEPEVHRPVDEALLVQDWWSCRKTQATSSQYPSLKQKVVLINMLPWIALITCCCQLLVAITVSHTFPASLKSIWNSHVFPELLQPFIKPPLLQEVGANANANGCSCSSWILDNWRGNILSTMPNRNKMVDWTAVGWREGNTALYLQGELKEADIALALQAL